MLVVDDEAKLVELVEGYLRREGFEVLSAFDGLAALELARSKRPDLVVLDVMLPGIDGIEVCRRLRQFSDAYVLMLTARSEEIDKIVGLSVGADDYLPKPFSPREMVARVRAMLRRPRTGAGALPEVPPTLRFGKLAIDPGRHRALRPRSAPAVRGLYHHHGRVPVSVADAAHPGPVPCISDNVRPASQTGGAGGAGGVWR